MRNPVQTAYTIEKIPNVVRAALIALLVGSLWLTVSTARTGQLHTEPVSRLEIIVDGVDWWRAEGQRKDQAIWDEWEKTFVDTCPQREPGAFSTNYLHPILGYSALTLLTGRGSVPKKTRQSNNNDYDIFDRFKEYNPRWIKFKNKWKTGDKMYIWEQIIREWRFTGSIWIHSIVLVRGDCVIDVVDYSSLM